MQQLGENVRWKWSMRATARGKCGSRGSRGWFILNPAVYVKIPVEILDLSMYETQSRPLWTVMSPLVWLSDSTIKGGSRRAEESRKVLMMMKGAKLGWAGSGAGQEQTMSRPGAGWEHARSRPGAMQEQGRSKSWAGALAVHIPNFIQIVLKT